MIGNLVSTVFGLLFGLTLMRVPWWASMALLAVACTPAAILLVRMERNEP